MNINPNLTDKQIAILLELVKKDARLHGLGTTWKYDANGQGTSGWPVRLSELNTIARKLWQYRYAQYNDTPITIGFLERTDSDTTPVDKAR